MKNSEIRAAVIRIVQIKSLREEERDLRERIIKEMKRRRKEKLDLGGPTKEDYVCLRSSEYREVQPEALLTNLEDKAVDAGHPRANAKPTFFKCVKVQLSKMREVLGRGEADHLRASLDSDFLYTQETLTYKISTDDKNQVRGIDL